jgi:hypothetical protein
MSFNIKPSIFIATPMYGGQCNGHYMCSIIAFIQKITAKGWTFDFRFIYNDALISRARNTLVHDFLKSTCSHLLFIDGDIIFDADDIIRMVEARLDVLCGVYPKKHIFWDKTVEAVKRGVPVEGLSEASVELVYNKLYETDSITEKSIVEVQDGGTGCMLIRRNVIEQLSNHVETFSSVEHSYGNYGERIGVYFDTGVDKSIDNYLSEDYFFCKKWRDIGGKIYVATWVKLKHVGMNIFG